MNAEELIAAANEWAKEKEDKRAFIFISSDLADNDDDVICNMHLKGGFKKLTVLVSETMRRSPTLATVLIAAIAKFTENQKQVENSTD
jgi:hypothetical protein